MTGSQRALTRKRKCSSSAEIRLRILDFERHIASLVTFSAGGRCPPGPPSRGAAPAPRWGLGGPWTPAFFCFFKISEWHPCICIFANVSLHTVLTRCKCEFTHCSYKMNDRKLSFFTFLFWLIGGASAKKNPTTTKNKQMDKSGQKSKSMDIGCLEYWQLFWGRQVYR